MMDFLGSQWKMALHFLIQMEAGRLVPDVPWTHEGGQKPGTAKYSESTFLGLCYRSIAQRCIPQNTPSMSMTEIVEGLHSTRPRRAEFMTSVCLTAKTIKQDSNKQDNK